MVAVRSSRHSSTLSSGKCSLLDDIPPGLQEVPLSSSIRWFGLPNPLSGAAPAIAAATLAALALAGVRSAHAQTSGPSLSASFTLGGASAGSDPMFSYSGGTGGRLLLPSGSPQNFGITTYNGNGTQAATGTTTGSLNVSYTPSGGVAGTIVSAVTYTYTIQPFAIGGGQSGTALTVNFSSASYTLNNLGTLSFSVNNKTGGQPGNQVSVPDSFTATYTAPSAASAAPEPGSLALLALTGLPVAGVIARRHRRDA